MKLPVFIYLFVFSCYCSVGLAQSTLQLKEEKDSSEDLSAIDSTSKAAEFLIKLLPDKNLREGLKEYLSIIDTKSYTEGEIGFGNKGISNYFYNQISKNTCFRKATMNFYKEVADTLHQQNPCLNGNEDSQDDLGVYGCYSTKPKLNEVAGVGSKSYLKPGWLFELAKKYSKGNAEMALQMITLCGHDDINQGSFWILDKSKPEALNQLKNFEDGFNCPDGKTDFFLPGSLSADADLSSDLKNKIKDQQGKGNFFPSAKYYHVYAGAFMACKLTKKNISSENAIAIEKLAAQIYRSIRMCDAINLISSTKDAIVLQNKMKNFENSDELESVLMNLWNNKNSGKLKCSGEGKLLNQECSLLSKTGILNLTAEESTVAKKKIQTAFARYDAAYLYKQWYIGGGNIAGRDIPCTNIRLKGPANLLEPEKDFLFVTTKPRGWSNERYSAATKYLATWDLDFEWTITQHAVGAKFGAELCNLNKNQKDPFSSPDCRDPNANSKDRFRLPIDFFEGFNSSSPSKKKSKTNTAN